MIIGLPTYAPEPNGWKRPGHWGLGVKVALFSKPKIKTLGLIDNGMEYFKLGLSWKIRAIGWIWVCSLFHNEGSSGSNMQIGGD